MHRAPNVLLLSLAAVCLVGSSGCGERTASTSAVHEHASSALTIWTDDSELFFEYPPMVAGATSEPWAIHVTRMADFKPVTEGSLTLTLRSETGQEYSFQTEAPTRPGIFLPTPMIPEPGTYQGRMEVRSSQLNDRIDVGSIVVYANDAAIPHDDEVQSGATIGFLKEQQWPIEFGVERIASGTVSNARAISGIIQPAAGLVAEVAVPVSGLLLAEANLRAPAPGDAVRKGQVLAVIAPIGGDNSYAQTKANVERLEREASRLQRLFDSEAVPERRLVEAKYDLEVARVALAAMGGAADSGYNLSVRAPISGVVNTRQMMPGAHVEVGDKLFTITNSSTVWLRLNLPARDAARAGSIQEVVFTVEGGEKSYRTQKVISIASMLDPSTRTLPVTLSVANPDGTLKIGMFADGLATIGGGTDGVAILNAAIQSEDGQPVAYVQTGGESFERRLLKLGSTDGTYTIVESGVRVGEYVVTKGAYQVYLGSLGTSEFGEGHAH